jgi:hypothetical protein
LGTDGTSGQNGTNGTSGSSGQNGSTGTSGTGVILSIQDTGITSISNINSLTFSGSISIQASGSNPNGNGALIIFGGVGGATMTSGTSGTSGVSGTNGSLVLNGTTNDGIITYNNGLAQSVVESSATYDSTGRVLEISGSADMHTLARIRPTMWTGAQQPTYVTPLAGMLMVSSSGANGDLMYYNGATWIKLA